MFHVDSEVGLLRQVILHRPDLELKRLTPDNAADLLFDDVLWVAEAQAEHDAFAAALRERGVVVHYYGELFAQTLEIAEARKYVSPDIAKDPAVYPPKDVVATLFLLKPLPPEIQRLETRLWTEFKSGR